MPVADRQEVLHHIEFRQPPVGEVDLGRAADPHRPAGNVEFDRWNRAASHGRNLPATGGRGRLTVMNDGGAWQNAPPCSRTPAAPVRRWRCWRPTWRRIRTICLRSGWPAGAISNWTSWIKRCACAGRLAALAPDQPAAQLLLAVVQGRRGTPLRPSVPSKPRSGWRPTIPSHIGSLPHWICKPGGSARGPRSWLAEPCGSRPTMQSLTGYSEAR